MKNNLEKPLPFNYTRPWSRRVDPKVIEHHWNQNYASFKVSLVAQKVKNLPAMQETQVQSLGQKDPLEKGMATLSCLENPMDRETWQATVHGVRKNQTWLSDLQYSYEKTNIVTTEAQRPPNSQAQL